VEDPNKTEGGAVPQSDTRRLPDCSLLQGVTGWYLDDALGWIQDEIRERTLVSILPAVPVGLLPRMP
jgi:hypothetical protein